MSEGMWSDEQFAALPSLSVAAHELKAPLALVRQLGLLLGDETIGISERAEYQRQLIVTSERALRLVMDLTQAANLQPSLFPLEPVNPFAVCREMAQQSAVMARAYRRRIAWPRARQGTLVVANAELLGRIIANFVDNALKYTEQGVPIAVTVNRHRDMVRVNIRDFGPQMTKREFRRLMNEMELKKTTRTRPESSGLGIFVAGQFARMMNGSIGLSRHRDGVTFFVELPLSQQMRLV